MFLKETKNTSLTKNTHFFRFVVSPFLKFVKVNPNFCHSQIYLCHILNYMFTIPLHIENNSILYETVVFFWY